MKIIAGDIEVTLSDEETLAVAALATCDAGRRSIGPDYPLSRTVYHQLRIGMDGIHTFQVDDLVIHARSAAAREREADQ